MCRGHYFFEVGDTTMQKLYPPATPPTAPAVKAINASRRAWLGGVSGAGLALAAGATSTPARAERVATKAHIVIAGSGLAGLALANRFFNFFTSTLTF